MVEVISERQEKHGVSYSRKFEYEGNPNRGFTFPCDEKGNLLVAEEDFVDIKANFESCLKGMIVGKKVVDKGVVTRHYTWFEPKKIRCYCNRVVELYSDTQCECGRWFDSWGQELRSNWMNNPSNYDEEIGDLF